MARCGDGATEPLAGPLSHHDLHVALDVLCAPGSRPTDQLENREEDMKLNRFHAAALLVAGVMAIAPAVAGAGSRYGRYGRSGGYPAYGGGGSRQYVGAPYRIYPDENRYG